MSKIKEMLAAMDIKRKSKPQGYAQGGEVKKDWHAATPDQQKSNAESAQKGFLAAANDNPISKLFGLGKSDGGLIEPNHVLSMILESMKKKQ